MGRPLAYEYKGFNYKGQQVPVWSDDTDSTQFYIMPPSMRVALDESGKPKVNVAICSELDPPYAKGLANLEPYISQDLLDALKAEYGTKIAPLPVASAGHVMVMDADGALEGLSVDEKQEIDPALLEGMTQEQINKLKQAGILYRTRNIITPLTSYLENGEGLAVRFPNIVGSNIGAELPISWVVRGKHPVKVFEALVKGGGVLNGQIVYYYVGTSRPWALQVDADLGQISSYMNQKFSGGYFWAKADINVAMEELKRNELIKFTVWDENDQITERYKPDKIFGTILERILAAAFDSHPNVQADKKEAQLQGKSGWWWSGSYSYKSSTAKFSDIFNLKITMHGKSEPIPVSMGFYVNVPSYNKCTEDLYADYARMEMINNLYSLETSEIMDLQKHFKTLVKQPIKEAVSK